MNILLSIGTFPRKVLKCFGLSIGNSARLGNVQNSCKTSTGKYPLRIAAARLAQSLFTRIKVEAASSNIATNIFRGKRKSGEHINTQMSVKIATPNTMALGSTRKAGNVLIEGFILRPFDH